MAGFIPPDLQVPPGMDPTEFLLQLPAMSPAQIPAGVDTTMTTRGPDQVWFLVVAVTCVAIPALFLIMRIYTRLAIFKGLELADHFLFLAFPLIIAEVVMGWYMVRWGAGVHQWQVTLGQLFNQLYWANIAQVIYCPLSFLVKMAILLQYLRLFAPCRSANKTMWYGAWLTIAATFIVYTIFMFWTLFYCSPRRMIWYKLTPGGRCHDVNDIVLSQGAFNIVSDIIVLLLPISSLWQLNVPLRRKMFITMLFATGLLACIASAMRIVHTVKIAPIISRSDVSHNGLFIGLWTEAEVSLGFIVACALCLPKLVQVKGKRLRQSLSRASGPFSQFSSKSRKSSMWTGSRKSTLAETKGSQYIMHVDEERPLYYEEREEQHRQALAKLQPAHRVPDAYQLPSTGNNSEYSPSRHSQSRWSQSIASKRVSQRGPSMEGGGIALQGIPRSISVRSKEVPVRFDPLYMPAQQRRHESWMLQEFEFETFRVTIDSRPYGESV